MELPGLIYTNENCISCNKCVKVCTSPGASYLHISGNNLAVYIDPSRCVSCGACFSICQHNARGYRDDTAAFFEDLARGEAVSLLVAPAFKAAYPREYGAILGGLKALGVRRIISVAFGADICTWAYLKYMEENDFYGAISTPCPGTVSYVEHCLPELIPRLMPVQSPMNCAAIYCREELGITDRLAFIGPCIGKKLEMEEYSGGPVQYNVTFLKLMEYVREHHVYGEDASDEIEYGLGSFYPAPGGLADNIRWFLGDDTRIRVVSGKTYLYGWLNKNAEKLARGEMPFMLVDALNCQDGCIEGTACEVGRFEEDQILYNAQTIREKSKSNDEASPWNPAYTPAERLERFYRQFAGLSLSHYLRTFTDRSENCRIRTPSPEEADRIFTEMHKTTPESRRINCSTCGYASCYDLMTAIYNHFNDKRSCIYYEKEEALRLERLSFYDQMTGALNRRAMESSLVNMMFPHKSVAVIAADINGLKEANDTYGHEAGDRLIITVANCLMDCFGFGNVFRTGGDEFLVILQDHAEQEVRDKIGQVRTALAQKNAGAAMGYSYRDTYASNFEEMKNEADKEMYADKELYYQKTGKRR